jgi:hypothetical protein
MTCANYRRSALPPARVGRLGCTDGFLDLHSSARRTARLRGVPVGFGVSLFAEGEAIDPRSLLSAVAFLAQSRGIEVHRPGNVVRFTAPQLSSLFELAAPIATWWQETVRAEDHQVDFRFVGPGGVNITSYCRPDVAPKLVRNMIEHDSGTPSDRDSADLNRVF